MYQLGAESGIDNPNLRTMKTVFRIMPLIILPLTINFPTVGVDLPQNTTLTPQDAIKLCCLPCVCVKLSVPRRCSPTGSPPTASPWVKWLCSGILQSDGGSTSQRGSNTRPQSCLRAMDLLRAWRKVSAAEINRLMLNLGSRFSKAQLGFVWSPGWKNAQLAHQLEERERRIKSHLDIAAKGLSRLAFKTNFLWRIKLTKTLELHEKIL